jgi:helix-turn-helix protein
MVQSTVADFVATITDETAEWDQPRQGRVLLGSGQLVLALSESDRVTIPLSSVLDINVGFVPQLFDAVPGTPVTVAYERDGSRSVAVVSGDETTIENFHTVLFKVILNETTAVFKHPARRGGRVTDSQFVPCSVSLSSGQVVFETETERVSVSPSSVTSFDRESREINGDTRPAFVLRHMQDGTALTTVAAMGSSRTLSLLGRYLRREYDQLMASLQDISLTEPEVETLVTLYSTRGANVAVGNVVDVQGSVKALLQSLHEDGLLRPTSDGVELTTRGQVVVNQYMERVNA